MFHGFSFRQKRFCAQVDPFPETIPPQTFWLHTQAHMTASRFGRFPREQVDAAMSARRAASSMRAEVDTLTRAGGAVQLLLRSEKERAQDGARAVREAAVPYYDALKRYGDGDAVTVNSVRASQTRRALAHSPHSAHPRCGPL